MGKTQVLFTHTDLPETVLQASVQIGRHCCSSGFIGRPHLPEKDTVVELHEKLTLTPRLPTAHLLWYPFNCSLQSPMSPCFLQLVGLDSA